MQQEAQDEQGAAAPPPPEPPVRTGPAAGAGASETAAPASRLKKALTSWQGIVVSTAAIVAAIATILLKSDDIVAYFQKRADPTIDAQMVSCKFDDLKIALFHRGGPPVRVGPPTFRIHSNQRPDNPLLTAPYSIGEPSEWRTLRPRSDNQEGTANYHYGGQRAQFYNDDERNAVDCTIEMTLPVENSTAIKRTCRCGD